MKTGLVKGIGHYVPERIVTNDEMTQYMDTSDKWIQERSGIKERRFFKEGEDTVSNMGAKAARKALEMAGMDVKEIDMIVFATLSPDYYFPGSGVLLERELGLEGIPAIDLRQQCSGFVYGISVAHQYIRTGMVNNVLVVGSEIQSNIFEMSTRGRDFAVLFGDGAGAMILQAGEDKGRGILSTHIHSDGANAEKLMQQHPSSSIRNRMDPKIVEEGRHIPYMEGQLVFKHAVQKFPEVIQEALDYNHLEVKDIDLLIPHQANLRISQYVQAKMGLRDDQVYNNIMRYGNTTAASIPIALSEAHAEGKIKEGELVCLAAFGAGFTWASALIRW